MIAATSLPRSSGIYAIRCNCTGKVYVGGAVNIYRRWQRHSSELKRGVHHSKRLQEAWNIYGDGSFSIEVLESVADKARLIPCEQAWIDRFSASNPECGYNISAVAGMGALGVAQTDEARRKRSASLKGRKRPQSVIDAVRRAAIGRKPSAETRQKLSAIRKRIGISAATRRKMADAMRGKPKSEAEKAAIRKSHPPQCSAEQVDQMIDLFTSGLSMAAIAKRFNVSAETVKRSFMRNGFDYRPLLLNRPFIRAARKVRLECDVCGAEFCVPEWKLAKNPRFCSRACACVAMARRPRETQTVTIACLTCGTPTVVPRHRSATAKYCSVKCRGAAKTARFIAEHGVLPRERPERVAMYRKLISKYPTEHLSAEHEQ